MAVQQSVNAGPVVILAEIEKTATVDTTVGSTTCF